MYGEIVTKPRQLKIQSGEFSAAHKSFRNEIQEKTSNPRKLQSRPWP